jgi:hypothetical protein
LVVSFSGILNAFSRKAIDASVRARKLKVKGKHPSPGSRDYDALHPKLKEAALRHHIGQLGKKSKYTNVHEYAKKGFTPAHIELNKSIGRHEGIARALMAKADLTGDATSRRMTLHLVHQALKGADMVHQKLTSLQKRRNKK